MPGQIWKVLPWKETSKTIKFKNFIDFIASERNKNRCKKRT